MSFWQKKYKWMRYILSALIALIVFFGVHQMISVEGASSDPQFVLLRLEDIGPGGQYATPEGLGKLRTVLDMLNREDARFSMAVIPRWINLSPDGTRYDRALDQTDDAYIRSFNRVLRQAVEQGAALGMHGYTHQVGDVRRSDGHHESAIGNEFDVTGLPETTTAAFAEERVSEGLRIFHSAGFLPRFWEAPHYHTAPVQEQVFRSHFGLIYQPNISENPNSAAAQYFNGVNAGFGAPSLSAVNVPTPYSYIPYNKDEKVILKQLGKTERLPSFFFHPFLEFKFLTPVSDAEGNAVMRDGLPDYQYPQENISVLQKLITELKKKNYQFYSINDYVPFTPAHRVEMAKGNQRFVIGDVKGGGESDLVSWDAKSGNISVVAGHFKGVRSDRQPEPERWAKVPYADGAAFALNHTLGESRPGLWIVQPNGILESYASDGKQFMLRQTWKIPAGRWSELYELRQPNGDCVLAGQSQDHRRLFGIYLHNGEAQTVQPFDFRSESAKNLVVREMPAERRQSFFLAKTGSSWGTQIEFEPAALQWRTRKVQLNVPVEHGDIQFGDFNGDGKEDIVRYDTKSLSYKVYLQIQDNIYKLLSALGPWGRANCRLTVADFDENGKKDIALISNDDASMDVALSFESRGR